MQALEGIRVLEMASYHAGPGGTAILGDLGAEVIKIEQPGIGDRTRSLTSIGSNSFKLPNGSSIFYEASNRSKKSITLDLRTDQGRKVAYRLASKSDIFLTNIPRGKVKK